MSKDPAGVSARPARRPAASASKGDRPAAPPARPSAAAEPILEPTGTARAGRRERARPAPRTRSCSDIRRWLVAGAVVAVVAVVGAGVFAAATQAGLRLHQHLGARSGLDPAADASPQPGYVQPDMGNRHVAVGTVVKYTYCPPASGRHYNAGTAGPIPARPYGPTTRSSRGLGPQPRARRLVVLYKGAEADEAALRALYDAVPVSPVCGFQPGGNSPGR